MERDNKGDPVSLNPPKRLCESNIINFMQKWDPKFVEREAAPVKKEKEIKAPKTSSKAKRAKEKVRQMEEERKEAAKRKKEKEAKEDQELEDEIRKKWDEDRANRLKNNRKHAPSLFSCFSSRPKVSGHDVEW
jgi:hypothetical protein